MRVGFLSNQLDNRGTGNAMFDYAKYNKDILDNESYIFTFHGGEHDKTKYLQYVYEFDNVQAIPGPNAIKQIDGVDVLYHIKYGNDDGIKTNSNVRYAVHSVFTNTPHGDRYATVSSWLSGDSDTPYVPHIIDLPSVDESYRDLFRIPETAKVFGRYGGVDTFDISWVWDVMEKILERFNNTWFLLANTEKFLDHPRVIYMDQLISPVTKTIFINTCDYMLHARHRGETFGISVGEFAIKGRPIITYGESGEKAHIQELGDAAYIYNDQFDLHEILTKLSTLRGSLVRYGYREFRPERVMEKFHEVFLT